MSNFCQRCKWEDYRYPYVLDFDHQHNKVDSVSNILSSSTNLDKVLEEIKKCQILCANCHRIKTKEDRDNINRFCIKSSQELPDTWVGDRDDYAIY